MTKAECEAIINAINGMAIQGPWCDTMDEFEAWLAGYKEGVDNVKGIIYNMVDPQEAT